MKFFTQLAILCLATGANSRAIIKRDVNTMTEVLHQVNAGIDSLDATVKGFSGDSELLKSVSANLTSTIDSCTAAIRKSPAVSFLQAFKIYALYTPVNDLKTQAKTLLRNFEDKKNEIQAAKQCGTTRAQISAIRTATQALMDAVIDNIPKALRGIATTNSSKFMKHFDNAVARFGPESCNDGATAL